MASGSRVRNALPPGTVLNGVYRVERMLDRGGFGIVYRAEHRVLGEVAIKEYLPAELAVRDGDVVRASSEREKDHFLDGLRRFEDEARQLVVFRSHPNVVSCREYFEAGGTAYMVMDYEDGPSLARLLQQREGIGNPLGEDDFRILMKPLLKGVSALHGASTLHRDITPANVIVRRRDEQPVLIDFGAVKAHVAQHAQSVAPYTPGYAAVEQVCEGDLGTWTDLYGLGALMWRIVAGGSRPWSDPRWKHRPWTASHPLRVELRVWALASGRPDPLPTAWEVGRSRYSRRVLEAIDKCLVLDERERVQNCGELQDLLGWGGSADGRDPRPAQRRLKDPEAPPRVPLSALTGATELRAGDRWENS